MATINFKGNPIGTIGTLPTGAAPDFQLVDTDLKDVSLASYAGKKKVVNIFPSIDTGVCAASVRAFHKSLAAKPGVVVLNVSADLPFAHKRFCAAEGIEGVFGLSTTMRSSDFGSRYGVTMTGGPLAGLLSRAVVVVDENNRIVHSEQVADITQEPNYDAVMRVLG
jgi:thioredoxin-dependent peroxiredoxin